MFKVLKRAWNWLLGYRGPSFDRNHPQYYLLNSPIDDNPLNPESAFLKHMENVQHECKSGYDPPDRHHRSYKYYVGLSVPAQYKRLSMGDVWGAICVYKDWTLARTKTPFQAIHKAFMYTLTLATMVPLVTHWYTLGVGSYICALILGGVSGLAWFFWVLDGLIPWLWYKKNAVKIKEKLRTKIFAKYELYLKEKAGQDMRNNIQFILTGRVVDLTKPDAEFEELQKEIDGRGKLYTELYAHWNYRAAQPSEMREDYLRSKAEMREKLDACDKAREALNANKELVRRGYAQIKTHIDLLEPYARDVIMAALQQRLVQTHTEFEKHIRTFAVRHISEFSKQLTSMYDGLRVLTDSLTISVLEGSATEPQLIAKQLVAYEQRMKEVVENMEQAVHFPLESPSEQEMTTPEPDTEPELA